MEVELEEFALNKDDGTKYEQNPEQVVDYELSQSLGQGKLSLGSLESEAREKYSSELENEEKQKTEYSSDDERGRHDIHKVAKKLLLSPPIWQKINPE